MVEPPPMCFKIVSRLFSALCLINTLSAKVAVNDAERQIPEFLFTCEEEPRITNCQDVKFERKFFMLIDENGNFLEEAINKKDSFNNTILVSRRQKAEKPPIQEIMDSVAYPSFLFQLERGDFTSGLYYIIASSGKLLTADDQDKPDLVLRKDYCTLSSQTTTSTTTTSTTATTNSQTEMGLSVVSTRYNCDQANWKLSLNDEKFLAIESALKEGFFLDVKRNRIVTLDGLNEKFTGIKTTFFRLPSDGPLVTLDRSAGETPEEGIGREDFGDVVIHYKTRDGSEQEAYICDYEWGLEDANSICTYLKYEAGIPTYDGRYSNTRNPEYAVSGVRCEHEDFENCKFRTICGNSDPSCLIQQSMKQFQGKGYACNKGSETDAAGVICGNQTTITKILQEKMKCNRDSIQKDKKSVAQMYSLQEQVRTTGSKMFENKHWSEYLLPMPMAISLMSTLLLVSSQFVNDVNLTKPSSGKWEHLKYDFLQANLLFLSNNVKNNFQDSNSNMGVIKVNSRKVHTNMKLAIGYAFSRDAYDSKTLLPRHLRYIGEDAAKSKEKAEEISGAFRKTGKIIEELLEALKNSESFHGNDLTELDNVLEVVKAENKKDEESLINEKKEKEKYDKKVEASRKAFFEAAQEAMNSQCVEEVTECNKCEFEPAKKLEECTIAIEKICIKYEDSCAGTALKCPKYKDVCAAKGDGNQCEKKKKVCGGLFGWGSCKHHCIRYHQVCISWRSECTGYVDYCTKPTKTCIEHDFVCKKHVYTEAGSYCQDKGNRGICKPCKWLAEVEATMKSVGQVQMQLQMDAMGDGVSYDGLAAVVGDTVGVVKVFKDDLENFRKWKDTTERNQQKISTTENMDIKTSDVKLSTTSTASTTTSTTNTSTTSSSTSTDKMKALANKKIRTQLRFMQQQLNMEIELLKEIKVPIAKKISQWLLQMKMLFDGLMQRNVQYIRNISEEEKIKLAAFYTKGMSLAKEAVELRNKKEVSFEPSSSADHKLGAQAETHTENLIKRRKTERNIESLTNKMRNSLREILKKNIKVQDLRATIQYLGDCFKHLNFLQLQWDSLKMFFQKLVDFLEDMKTEITRMKDMYDDIGMISLDQPLSQSFKERLQTKIVEGLANNIYVMRISYFYTKIAEEGLLDRMSMIGSNLKKVNSPKALERYKKYISDDAIMTQERIKAEISKEEAMINDRITNEVAMIKNNVACGLEDRKEQHLETKLTLEAFKDADKLLSSENNEKNIRVTIETATEDDINTMTLFDDAKLGMNALEEDEENIDDFINW